MLNHRQTAILLATALLTQISDATPPLPPEGTRWIINEKFSDEFNGTELDSSKWHDHHPNWKGREPGIFLPSQVSIGDGYMMITSKKLKEPIKHGKYTFTMAGGAVVSKTTDASFGYYECRFKAAKTSMSTTFWLSTRKQVPGPKGSRYGLELDIQECIGREGDFKGSYFAKGMHSNAHFWYRPPGKKSETQDLRATQVKIPSDDLCSDDFNTYGGWWRDESGASFYFNDGDPHHMEFYSQIKKKPFDQTMGLNMVSESYPFPWIELPTDAELDDPKLNTCYYDWARAYTLIDVDAPADPPSEPWANLYSESVAINSGASKIRDDQSLSLVLSHTTNSERQISIEVLNKASDVVASKKLSILPGYGNRRIEIRSKNMPSDSPLIVSATLSTSDPKDSKPISNHQVEIRP